VTVKGTKLHEITADRIRESIDLADQLSVADPCSLTIEAKGLLRRAHASISERAAAIRVLGGISRRPAEKPVLSETLRQIQAERARQPRPRRQGLAGLFGSRT
jgi:hypothetical protein